MSISGSLFNAYSGLTAAARTAETISQNVSNALTEGYGRREVELVSTSIAGRGAGVRVASVLRITDQIAITDRRRAQAEFGEQTVRTDTLTRIEDVIGLSGDGDSLSDLVAAFESTLVLAQSQPDSQVRQQNILYAANDLTAQINQISETTQDIRVDADQSIASQVDLLNTNLDAIAELNRDIRLQIGAGHSVNGLLDQRQVLIDQISEIIPIKTYPREKGAIAITSTSGAVLLDGTAAEFGFAAAGLIVPEMTLASGALSGLTMNGKDISVGSSNSLIDGGSLSALFETRDKTAPFASAQIDAFARNLMERFEETGLDSSISSGDPGLFTDAGAALDISQEAGLAGRLSLNSAVDPDEGGALWRLRDGLGAVTPGDTGDRALLSGFIDILTANQTPATGQFSAGASSLSELADDLTALNSAARLDAEQAQVFAQSRFQELQLIEQESGVDTDQEMQKLLLVEHAYAANARVMTTVDEMLRAILEL